MVEVTSLGAQLVDFYKSLVLTLPVWLMDFINLFLLVFLTEGYDVKAILIISATIIGAIRVTSYIPKYGENISRDLAKLWPLNLLAIAVSKPGFLSIERILNHFHEIPIALGDFTIFLLFIIILEILLRSFDFIFMIFGLNEQEVED